MEKVLRASANENPAARCIRRLPVPPRRVSDWHIGYTLVFCVAGMIVPSLFIADPRPADFLVIPAAFIVANFVEYIIHRWPLHRKYKGLEFMLDLHMLHHDYFDETTYQIDCYEDFGMIVFPPIVLNMLALVVTPAFCAVAWWLFGRNAALLFYATVMGYYMLMQLLHVLTHLPAGHWIANLPGIHYLWVHHKIHHTRNRMVKVNFNFIVPIADIVFGTSTQK